MRKRIGALAVLVVLMLVVVPLTVVAQAGTTSSTNSGMTKEERQAAFKTYAERNSADSGQATADAAVQDIPTVTATAGPGGGRINCSTNPQGAQCQGGGGAVSVAAVVAAVSEGALSSAPTRIKWNSAVGVEEAVK